LVVVAGVARAGLVLSLPPQIEVVRAAARAAAAAGLLRPDEEGAAIGTDVAVMLMAAERE
jgi:hypothetical protein